MLRRVADAAGVEPSHRPEHKRRVEQPPAGAQPPATPPGQPGQTAQAGRGQQPAPTAAPAAQRNLAEAVAGAAASRRPYRQAATS